MARNLAAVARAVPNTVMSNPTGAFGGAIVPATQGGPASPLIASYAEWSAGRASSALPRDFSTFLAGTFGPLMPMQPQPIDQPKPGEERPEPRRFTYQPSWNMPHGQPGEEGLKLAGFGQLRIMADAYSVARACIQLRIQEILAIEWDIVPTKDAEKAMRGDRAARREFDQRRAPVKGFFNRPDPGKYHGFESWLSAVLEEIFVVDALSLYLQPSKTRGKARGIPGSNLGALCLIAGDIVRPMLDLQGGIPQPPNVAWQIYQYGVPRVDLMTTWSGDDVKDMRDALTAEYRADQMMYLPYTPRSWTPYGLSNVEQALVPITSGLQRQQYQLDYYTQGCYDSETEILTRDGWKLFEKLADSDEVATRSERGRFEWQQPTDRQRYRVDGDLVEFSNKSIDLLVTPNHRMLVKPLRQKSLQDNMSWHFKSAQWFADRPGVQYVVPATSEWFDGSAPTEFLLPGHEADRRHPAHEKAVAFVEGFLVEEETPAAEVLAAAKAAGVGKNSLQMARGLLGISSRKTTGTDSHWMWSRPTRRATFSDGAYSPCSDLRIPIKAFCEFLGLFLAEGWVRSGRSDVLIAQMPTSRHVPEIERILTDTGMYWSYMKANDRYVISHQGLANWLRENVGHYAWGKRIPPAIKDYPGHLLEALLHGMMLGDGHWGPAGQRYYTTTSYQMANDVQEVFQKIGVDAWVRTREPYQHERVTPGVRVIQGIRPTHVVRERLASEHMVPPSTLREYHGDVHCVTVPNGVVYVRRNGKAVWCGNSTPGVFLSTGDPNSTPNQCRELQDALNAMAGDPAWKHKIIVIPGGSKIDPIRPTPLADQFDEIVMTQVCMAFDVMPMELGISTHGSRNAMGAASNIAKASEKINARKALKPLLKWLKANIFDYAIREHMHQPDMQWHWEGLEEGEDEAATVDVLINEMTHGIVSIDEARVIRGHQPWGIPLASEPVYFTATGITPLGSIDMATGAPVGAPPTNAMQAAAGVVPGAPPVFGAPPGGPGKPSEPNGKPKPKGPGPNGSGGGGGAPTPAHAGAQAAVTVAGHGAQALPTHPKPLPKPVLAHQDPDSPLDRVSATKMAEVVDRSRQRLGLPRYLPPEQIDDLFVPEVDGPALLAKGHPHPGQHYTHGWVPTAAGLDEPTYFRVQSGDRDPVDLLDPADQVSHAWGHEHLEDRKTDRTGVSATRSREELAQYLATYGEGIPYGLPGWQVVEMRGYISDDQPLDAEGGEVLIHPTEIVSAKPIDNEFFDLIGNHLDSLGKGATTAFDPAAALRELDLIGNRLTKGRPLNGWTNRNIPADVFTALRDDGDVTKARAAVQDAGQRQRRDTALAAAQQQVITGLHQLAAGVGNGSVSTPGFIDAAVALMRAAIHEGLRLGTGHALVDAGRATQRTAWATKAASDGPGWVDGLDGRFGLYAGSIPHAYELGYGLATLGAHDDPDNLVIEWHARPDACDMCDTWSTMTWTADTLPGMPGEGGFGKHATVCFGGPACRCILRHRLATPDEVEAIKAQHADRPATPAQLDAADQRAQDAEAIRRALAADDPNAALALVLADLADERAEAQRGWLTGLLKDILTAATRGANALRTWLVTKAAKDDTPEPEPDLGSAVMAQMRENYPPKALGWMKDAQWSGPVDVPLDDIDFDDIDRWAASHDKARVKHFRKKLRRGEPVKPAVAVQEPGGDKVKIIDGHHRSLAARKEGQPVRAYVGTVDADGGPWDETHVWQHHHGADPANKAAVTDLDKVRLPPGPRDWKEHPWSHGWVWHGPTAIGTTIDHKSFGKGHVTGTTKTRIKVMFPDGKERTFPHAVGVAAGKPAERKPRVAGEPKALEVPATPRAEVPKRAPSAPKEPPAPKKSVQAKSSVSDFTGNYAHRQKALKSHAGEPTVTPLEGGISSKVELLTYPDGSRVVRKDYGTDKFDHIAANSEELAALVLDAFGLPTPAVARHDSHTVLMEYVDGKQGGETGVLKAPANIRNSPAGRLLGLADAIMGHRDRGGGNWMRVHDGIVPIDNGNTFEGVGADNAAHGNPFASYLMTSSRWKTDVDVERTKLNDIRTRLAGLRPEFQRLGFSRQYKDMLARLDEIEKRARRGTVTKAAKSTTEAAGLAVRAADTGRVLMLQRALPRDDEDDDPSAGTFEMPGGKLEPGEKPIDAARREWAEETGCEVPDGKITGTWASDNGVYEGFVLTIPHEVDVSIFGDRDPDPDGDSIEAIVWWDPAHLADNPAVRPELADTLDRVLRLLPAPPANKCMTCGCSIPGDDHGDHRHITYLDLQAAADAAGIDVEQAAANLQRTLDRRADKNAVAGHHVPGTPLEYSHGWHRRDEGAVAVGAVKKKLAGELLKDAAASKGKEVTDPAALEAAKGVFEGTHAGLSVKVKKLTADDGYLEADLSIHDHTGQQIGRAVRIVQQDQDGNLYATHDLLKVSADTRGQGFSQSFNRQLEDWYRESGIQRIQLHANIDVGGYAWARAGYDWHEGTVPNDIRNRLAKATVGPRRFGFGEKAGPGSYYIDEDTGGHDVVYHAFAPGHHLLSTHEFYDEADNAITQHAMENLPPLDVPGINEARALLARIDAGETPTPYEISEVGRPAGATRTDRWIGKDALLGSDWDGVKWL